MVDSNLSLCGPRLAVPSSNFVVCCSAVASQRRRRCVSYFTSNFSVEPPRRRYSPDWLHCLQSVCDTFVAPSIAVAMAPHRLPPRSQVSHAKRWLVLALLATSLASVAVLNYRGMVTSVYFNRFEQERSFETKLRNSKVVDELVTLLLAKQEQQSDVDNGRDNNTVSAPTPAAPTAAIEAVTPLLQQPAPRSIYQGDEDRSELHIVFSMSCDQGRRVPLQTILQYSAVAVGQRGPITQILSGCTDAQREKVMREPTLYYDFRRHFTPSYSPHPLPNVTDHYTPYNKPFALRHFLRNAQPPVKHEIIALIDGAMVFFKPLEVNTGRDVTKYYHGK